MTEERRYGIVFIMKRTGEFETLRAELIACDYWDSCFLRTSCHDLIDTIAFVNRQRRRKELLAAIVTQDENESLFVSL
jgi:glutaminase